MYQFSYAEIQTDSIAEARDRERQLISRSIELLGRAKTKGAASMEAVEAIHFTNRVWTSFMEDLGSDDNELPKDLRANLLSIGMWVLREADAVRQGQSENFEGLIEVSAIIRDGIK
jgi:flagellar biosynthesis activator protein FlaF